MLKSILASATLVATAAIAQGPSETAGPPSVSEVTQTRPNNDPNQIVCVVEADLQ